MKGLTGRLFGLFLTAVMLLLCGLLVVTNWQDFRDYRGSDDWVTTTGIFTVLPGQSNLKSFAVRYEYMVDGVNYTGGRIYFFEFLQFGGEVSAVAQEWVALRRLGDEVLVHYDPQHPERAVLYTGFSGPGLAESVFYFAGLLCFVGGPLLLIGSYFLFLRRFFRRLFAFD